MSRFVRLFQPRFAPLVESGEKCQTVRPIPKRMPKVGDLISLREWTGKPYRSKQRILRDNVIITDVRFFTMNDFGVALHDDSTSQRKPCVMEACDAGKFILADGFACWQDMQEWFKKEHGLPFHGIVIYWEGIK